MFLFLVNATVNTFAQKNFLITFQNLLKDNKDISSINCERIKYINIPDTPLHNFEQYLIKTRQGLFVFINGSGRLYEVLNNNGNLEFKRIDSTFFFGYNLGSFPFAYHDTIYSLGGYGYWRTNGQLRMYVEKARRWDVIGLNEEIPLVNNSFTWYDKAKGKIYIGRSRERNQAVKSKSLNETYLSYDVAALDLATRNWKKLGTLNKQLREKYSLLTSLASSPWGQLVNLGNRLIVIDYGNNRLLHLKQSKEQIFRTTVFADPDTRLYYFKDSTLYFGSTAKNRLDSIQLHLNDFLVLNELVYTPFKSESTVTFTINEDWIYLTGGIIVLTLIGLFIRMKKKTRYRKVMQMNGKFKNSGEAKKRSSNVVSENVQTNGSSEMRLNNGNGKTTNSGGVNVIAEKRMQQANDHFKNNHTKKENELIDIKTIFEEKELQTLILIYCSSVQGKTTSIDELNKILGVTQKSIEIQKKQRSDTIISINKKYSLIVGRHSYIIERKKNEFDKRSFDYFIDHTKIEAVNKILNN